MKIAHIDCAAGASGDMFLGAWLDLGVDESQWRSILNGLHVPGYEIRRSEVFRNGIRACKVDVIVDHEEPIYDGDHAHHHIHTHAHSHHPHRHLPEIFSILDSSDLPVPVRDRSKAAFQALAEAEGKVHGMPAHEVHFHEVGAIDAIVDIVGAMTGWYLAGMPECYVSPIEVGTGTVKCAHGVMPVPVPATVALLTGFPVYSSGVVGEMVTPTGAAILRTLCRHGVLPTMVGAGFGYGAGASERSIANVLRIRVGERSNQFEVGEDSINAVKTGSIPGTIGELACVLEANLDDMTPEVAAYVTTKLMDLGAMDAWLTPIVMKKGRAAIQLHVLCAPSQRAQLMEVILNETSTLGVRFHHVEKTMWQRELRDVETEYGRIQVKVATDILGNVKNIAPEFEDCRRLAGERKVPLKEIYRAALAATATLID